MMVGPLLGSVLYAIGGFQLPFYVTGGGLFLLTILTFFTLPEGENFAPDMRWSPNSGVMKKNELTYLECLSNTVRLNQFIVYPLESRYDCIHCHAQLTSTHLQRASAAV